MTKAVRTYSRGRATTAPRSRKYGDRRISVAAGRSALRAGMVNVWVVLILLTVIGFVGLALDVAYGFMVGGQLQNAADAASLAGVQHVRDAPEDVRQAAIAIGLANRAAGAAVELSPNEANASEGDIVIGNYSRSTGVFTPTLYSPNAVKVVARKTGGALGGSLPLLFGPIFGVNTIDIERTAIAMIGGGTGAGLITLNETDPWTFRLSGTVTLSVYDQSNPNGDGAIQVNSDDYRALKTDGTPTLLAEEINVHADSVTDPPVFDGDVNTSQPRISDPLASIAEPTSWGPNCGSFSATGGTYSLTPGYYPDGISMTGGTVYLRPGLYVLDGQGLNVTGGNLIGNGVMLFIVNAGQIKLTGNGMVQLGPPDLELQPYGGILVWQQRGNSNEAEIRGTDQFEGLDGTVYLPSARADITGTSDSFKIRQLICDSAEISGVGTVTINYDGRNPAPGTTPFLVK